ncbi:hypothetical protein GIW57_04555 [Stenotrophomonas sp. PA-6-5C]|uniref:hypothetical protein n=1 Tax=Stenotrophomonas sp. PA-6-5C TaxID=2665487 RepID=UPI001F3301CE|nr:hypothetical protein [Stenotrophomonas sp. PA-6-5C]MCF5089446.1 hypothetical protein [Stenotrophomonas sp. PA-6-5C]
MLVVTLVLVALVLGLNLVATFVVLGREEVSAGGRTVQLLLVWLLPLVGAIVCMAMATADDSPARGDGTGGGPADFSGGYSGDSNSHHSYSSSDCGSGDSGGGGDGGSCGGGD